MTVRDTLSTQILVTVGMHTIIVLLILLLSLVIQITYCIYLY